MAMINLLPIYAKEEIAYGRRNRQLLRWALAVVVVIVGVAGITFFGQLYINKNTQNLQAVTEITEQRINSQNLTSTEQQLQTLSNNFRTVTQLLAKQLLFSKLLVKIGSIIPSKAFLSGITLSTTSSALDLNVVAENREATNQAFININDSSNGLFEKADLVTLSCNYNSTAATETLSKYPCSALIRVIIKTDSSLYFLNSITSGAKQ
jgi:Tfp pilus assembly protein PilN